MPTFGYLNTSTISYLMQLKIISISTYVLQERRKSIITKAAYGSCLLRYHSSPPTPQKSLQSILEKQTHVIKLQARKIPTHLEQIKVHPENHVDSDGTKASISSLVEAVDSALDNDNQNIMREDELESWLREPMWTSAQYQADCTAFVKRQAT